MSLDKSLEVRSGERAGSGKNKGPGVSGRSLSDEGSAEELSEKLQKLASTSVYVEGRGHGEKSRDDSENPRKSRERGPVAEDVELIKKAIVDQATASEIADDAADQAEAEGQDREQAKLVRKQVYEQALDSELRNRVLKLPKDRLEAAATYPHSENNHTLLHIASKNSDSEIVELLLANGANCFVDLKNTYGFTPLMYAVNDCCDETVRSLLGYSDCPEDALCFAICAYEQEEEPASKGIRQRHLEWLLTLPQITGKKEAGQQQSYRHCFNKPSQSAVDMGKHTLTAFQYLCFYKDKYYFEKLLEILRSNARDSPKLQDPGDDNGDKFLHLAVRGAGDKDGKSIELINYLLPLTPKGVNDFNHAKQTALNIASEQKSDQIIKTLAAHGAMLIPDTVSSKDRGGYVSPLHQAIRRSDIDQLEDLLGIFSEESKLIFKDKDVLGSLVDCALNVWREKVIANEDHTSEFRILRVLLQYDLSELILNSLFEQTEKAINTDITDLAVQGSLRNLCSKLHSDFRLVSRQFTDAAIEQKLKIVCSVTSIKKVSEAYSKKEQSIDDKMDARDQFLLCSRLCLYSNKIKTLVGITVCALFGMIVGGFIGFIIGQFLSGGTGGGFVLGPPAAEYGWAVGTILGCMFFGIGLGGAPYLFSDLFKSQISLWSISKALNNNLSSMENSIPKKEGSPRSGQNSESNHDFDGRTELSFEAEGVNNKSFTVH